MLGFLSGAATALATTSVASNAAAILGGAARLTAGAVIAKVGTDMARPVVERIVESVVGLVARR